MTTPTEFVLWLNGATGAMGDSPTPEQQIRAQQMRAMAMAANYAGVAK